MVHPGSATTKSGPAPEEKGKGAKGSGEEAKGGGEEAKGSGEEAKGPSRGFYATVLIVCLLAVAAVLYLWRKGYL